MTNEPALPLPTLNSGHEIVHRLQDEDWGVRRFFLRTSAGHVVNVQSSRPNRPRVPGDIVDDRGVRSTADPLAGTHNDASLVRLLPVPSVSVRTRSQR